MAKAYISDVLVIRATHPVSSTGGVGRWNVKVTKAIVAACSATRSSGEASAARR